MKKNNATRSTVYLVKIALLSAFSVILHTYLRFPLFPPPYNVLDFDFSFIPSLLGGFALGPFASVAIEGFKVLFKFILQGTGTGGVGELSNFIVSVSFVLPASIIYRFKKTRKGAMLGMLAGILINALVSSLLNYYIIIPLYVNLFGPGAKVYLEIRALFSFGYGLAFNLIRTTSAAIVVFFTYKRITRVLHI